MSFLTSAKERYSCRSFAAVPVEQEKIDALIAAAQAAPTAVNHQPFKIFLAQGQAVETVRQAGKIRFAAPLYLIVGADAKEAWVRKEDDRNFADVDASIAATHILMEVQDLGLHTVWVGHFDVQGLKQAYPSMQDLDLIAVFPIGYAGEDALPSYMHAKRKPVEELVEVLK